MPIKQLTITMAAAALFAVVGSTSGSAQENCGRQYERVTEASCSRHATAKCSITTTRAASPAHRPDRAGKAIVTIGMTTIAAGMTTTAAAMTTSAEIGADNRLALRPKTILSRRQVHVIPTA